jgi:hypothetical protein
MNKPDWITKMDGAWSEQHLPRRVRVWIVAGLIAVCTVGVFLSPPVHQNLAYNHFADARTFLGVPYFYDVVTNLPLVIIGLWGFCFVLMTKIPGNSLEEQGERWAYLGLFFGVLLTGLGSSYYHLNPSDQRLVYDRLPMTTVFMSLFASVLSERVNRRLGKSILLPLLAIGITSVVYWHWTELRGSSDLRVYIEVQYLPMLAMPLIALLFSSRYTSSSSLYAMVGLYILAKAFELLDAPIFKLGHLVSGHSLKHLLAGLAAYVILCMLMRRKPRESGG